MISVASLHQPGSAGKRDEIDGDLQRGSGPVGSGVAAFSQTCMVVMDLGGGGRKTLGHSSILKELRILPISLSFSGT